MKISQIISTDKKITGSFTEGFFSSFRAIALVRGTRGFKKYFVAPFLLNLMILSGIFFITFVSIYPRLLGLIQGDAWYLEAIRFLLIPVLVLALAIITVLLYSIIGIIVTAPFNDFISLKAEEVLTGHKLLPLMTLGETPNLGVSTVASIRDIIRVLGNVSKMMALLIILQLIFLLINLIPAAGSVLYSILSFLCTSFFLGFQFFDYPLERRRLKFEDKLKIAWRYKYIVMGLGAGFFVMSFIPVVGFLALNLSTIGGTVLFIDHIKPAMKITADTGPQG